MRSEPGRFLDIIGRDPKLVFLSAIGYMLTSFGFPYMNLKNILYNILNRLVLSGKSQG